YTRTVFEVLPEREGGQSAIVGGGRYDGLIEQIGGKPTPAVGFATGMERIILNLRQQGVEVPVAEGPTVYMACMGQAPRQAAVGLARQLRNAGIGVVSSTGSKSLKAQLRQSNSLHMKYSIILGEDEVQAGTAVVRNMSCNEQTTLRQDQLTDYLKSPPCTTLDA
ncbi:MAG: ATP phosphoribosyltransferase regulatory subunit, partial [Dehalococcoidia bacterium]|nr:ATP phosphoribosyltransferase regulatory subunit [Dehalococcoidia bacterium]